MKTASIVLAVLAITLAGGAPLAQAQESSVPQAQATPANRPDATRCHARCQCPRNSRSEATGNKSPAPDLADPCEEHRTSGKDPRRTRRTSPRQEAHSAAGKKDGLVTAPHPRSRSTCPPASPDPGVFPSPYLNAKVMPF